MTLLAAYNFDEASGNVLDRSGNGRDFSLAGSGASRTTGAGGHTSEGLTTASQGAPATIASGASMFGRTADRTVMAWAKLATTPGSGWLVEWSNSTENTGTWGLLLLSGQMQARGRTAAGAVAAQIAAPTDGAWHHWAAIYQQTTDTLTLYRDGASVATATLGGTLRTDADFLYLLDQPTESNDVIDDVRIYDQALSGATISTLMGTPVVAAGGGAAAAALSGSGSLTATTSATGGGGGGGGGGGATGTLVGKRNLQPRGFTTGNTSYTYRIRYPVAITATGLKLTFPAWGTPDATTGDAATGNVVNIGAAYVEYGGTAYPVTFNGGASTAAIPSGGQIDSDVVSGLSVVAGQVLYARTYVTVASGGSWPSLYGAYNYPDEVSQPGVNLANGTGTLEGTGQTFSSPYGPIRIFGTPAAGQPLYAVQVYGDSIAAGVSDNFGNEGEVGYWQRVLWAAGNTRPYAILALPGEAGGDFVAAKGANRRAVLGKYAHHFVSQYGINDLQQGVTLAQLQATTLSIGALAAAESTVKGRFQQTLTPKTSSTDGWTTTGGQTSDGLNATRVPFNDWVRDGLPTSGGVAVATGTVGALRAGQTGHPFTGYIEVADLAETARNSGIWKANYTADGLHPNGTGNAALATGLSLSVFTDTTSVTPAPSAFAVTHAVTIG